MEEGAEQTNNGALRDLPSRRQYWSGQVERWRGSGLTQKEYCFKEGISLERLGRWKRRLDREGQRRTGGLVAIPSGIVSSALHVSPPIKLVVNGRYRVEIPDAFSPVTLEAVLHVLDRL